MINRYVIFIRHGKTGGTSFEHALAGENGSNDWKGAGLITVDPQPGKITEVHSMRTSYLYGIDEFKAKFPGIWEEAFKFTLVRNPYDRFVSAWHFFRSTRQFNIEEVLKRKFSRAIEFHLRRLQTEGLIVDGKLDVDHIVRFEDFQNSFDNLCDILEIERRVLPHLRTSKHKIYQRCLNGFSEEVYNLFVDDFKYLNYDKKL